MTSTPPPDALADTISDAVAAAYDMPRPDRVLAELELLGTRAGR
ncbi:hypothetical protein AAG589_10405 [Isoptericola sp. F-RaC21]